MKLQIVPARQGAMWVRQGFALFFRQPMAFAGLFMAFLFSAFVISLLPWIGPLLMQALLPLASLGFMIAGQRTMEGRFPTPRVFIEPLRTGAAQRKAILLLGVVYTAGTVGIMLLSDLADGGALEALLEAMPAGRASPELIAEKLADPQLGNGLLLRAVLTLLLALPFWYAPALVHWGRQTAGKSLFFSTVACWRNWRSMFVYLLCWSAVGLVASTAALLLITMGLQQVVVVAALPGALVMLTIFYASLYPSFADCFTTSSGPLEPAAAGEAEAPHLP